MENNLIYTILLIVYIAPLLLANIVALWILSLRMHAENDNLVIDDGAYATGIPVLAQLADPYGEIEITSPGNSWTVCSTPISMHVNHE